MAPSSPSLAGLRVVFLNWRDPDHSLAGGSERYAWEGAQALRAAGAEVEFLTARDTGQLNQQWREGLHVVRVGGRFTHYPRALARLLGKRLRGHGPDLVVDAANGIPTFSPLVVGETPVLLLVHHVHQTQFLTYFPAPLAHFGRFLEGPAMRRVYRRRRTVVVSESTDQEMRRQLGWQAPTVLVPNGNALPDVTVPDLVAAKLGPTRRLVVFGRMAVHKRVDLAVRAFARVRAEAGNEDLHLDVVGTGPNQAAITSLVSELGLSDSVAVHGFVSEAEKQRLLSGALLNVCASDAEGWGQVVIEAAGHGAPTLARDVPGLRESIRPGHTGWLVPGDLDAEEHPARVVDQLADGLRTALTEWGEPERAAALVAECRAWAGEYSWERMRERWVALVSLEVGRDSAAGQSLTTLPRR